MTSVPSDPTRRTSDDADDAFVATVAEELIDSDRAGTKPQVAESPDRGLDAETPSGDEAERARSRAKPKQARRA